MGDTLGTVLAGAAIPLKFQRNLPFLNSAGSLGINASAGSAELIPVLASETAPFPDKDFEIGQISVTASTPEPIVFGRGSLKASFTAKAGAFAGIGVYRDVEKVLKTLSPNEAILPGLDLGPTDDTNFLVLRWGFDAEAKASGAIALGAVGKATLAVEGSADGHFAVVRRLPRTLPARTALHQLANSWMLPRQVTDISDLAPGTWLVSEVGGSVGIKVGVQAGWDFNWIRETKLGTLQGDIGLRLDLAVKAAFGFRAEGRWAVVVARETDAPELRLRLFRLKSQQTDFSFKATAGLTGVNTLLPRNADDLIKGIFGTHGAQVLAQIAVVEKWTNPSKKLTDLLAEAGVDQAKNLIAHVANVPVDQLDDKFNNVQKRVAGLVNAWRDLDHKVAATILKMVEDKVDLGPVREIAKTLKTATPESLKSLLAAKLGATQFLTTPEGRLLDSLAGESGVLSLLNRPLAEVRSLASQIAKLLDGGMIEESLGRFQQFIEDQLNVGKVLNVITTTDFNSMDALLKKKLADFLGKTGINFADLDQIRGVIHNLLNKRQEFFEKALNAFEKTYTAEFAVAFQKSVTRQAHLDLTFDFRNDPAGVSDFLKSALAGDFDRVMTESHPSVRFGLATLSHGIRRKSHVELTLPYFKASQTHLNEALATVKAIDDSGRVLVFELDAEDTIATNKRNSSLALALSLSRQSPAPQTLRVHQADSFRYTYFMRQAIKRATRDDLDGQLRPLFTQYLTNQNVDGFLAYFDARTEEVIPETPDFIGNTFINLQLSLSGAAAAFAGDAWLNIPKEGKDRLPLKQKMSEAIQNVIRDLTLANYFQSAERFQTLDSAFVLLAWAALPAFNSKGKLFWDWPDLTLLRARLDADDTRANLAQMLGPIAKRLGHNPGTRSFYEPSQAAKILANVKTNDPRLAGLLSAEAGIIDTAASAYDSMAKFDAAQKPSKAIEELAKFGSKLTEAFNSKVTNLYLGGVSRALGTAIYLAATKALAGSDHDLSADALLTITALRSDAVFDTESYLATGAILPDRIAAQELLTSISK